MTTYTDNLTQEATYWAPGANDGFGGVEFTSAPVLIACRWQDKSDLIRTAQGEEKVSSAVLYVDRVLAPKGYVVLGDYTWDVDSDGLSDPREVTGAQEVMQFGSSPSLDASMTIYKAWV